MISPFISNLFMLLLIILQLLSPFVLNMFSIAYTFKLAVVEYLTLFIPAIIYIIFTKQNFKSTCSIKSINFKTVLLLSAFAVLVQPSMGFLSGLSSLVFPNNVPDAMIKLNELPFISALFIMAITPAICEELAFRGVFASGYKNVDIKRAALMNGLMFAVIHLNGQQFLYAFVMGVIFAYIVYITGSIFSSMLIHFIFNGSQLILARIVLPSTDASTAQALIGINNTQLLYIGIIAYGILVLLTLPIIYIIFKTLIKINKKEIVVNESFQDSKIITEKIFNWPVVAIIVIYVMIVIVPVFVT